MVKYKLSNNLEMPSIGLGVWKSKEEEGVNAVKIALENGYDAIDTAMIYQNEEEVGRGIKASGRKREDLFITSKLWNDDIRARNVKEAFFATLKRLDLTYLDLYLIHWPAEGYVEAYLEIEKLYKEGYIKAIGVSNFNVHHLEDIFKVCSVKPMVNQIEVNPGYNNNELIEYCKKHNILVTAYSPFGSTGAKFLNNDVIMNLASKYNKSSAQIILRWCIEKNISVVPKSVTKERIISNIDVFNFKLSEDDHKLIDSLNDNLKTGADPENFTF